MTGADLRAILNRSGASPGEFGALIGVARRTVQAWGEGRAEIPASVASLARIMDAVAQREPREIVARVMRAEAELLSTD